jgi:ice-binding like protein
MKLFKYRAGKTRSRSIAMPTIGLLLLAVVGFALAFAGSARSAQATIDLGAAASFGALSATAMTNAGANTVVTGNVGSSTSIDAGVTNPGFAQYGAGTPELAAAQASLTTAYDFAAAQTQTGDITGVNLAGQTLGPGVYNATSSILISGPTPLTLNAGGDPNAVFIIRAVSDLTVDPDASVTLTGGAQPCNVFWKVQSAWLKNTGHTFVGTILALTQITLTDSITVEGRVLARNADVTFIHDTVNRPTCAAPPVTSSTTTTAATTTAATTTAATTTAATTTAATTTTVGVMPPGATTTSPATTARATTTTTPSNSPAPKQAKAAKSPKAKVPTRGHARPPRHRFGLTG